MNNLVSATDLREAVYHGKKITLLASHWAPGEGAGYRMFESEHIPTALFCDPSTALAGVPGSHAGRNPLPDPGHLQRWFGKWGLDQGSRVVVYDEGRGLYAARAWWVLRWAGLENVTVLDGGLPSWEHEGYPVVGGPGNITAPGDAKVSAGQLPVATIDDVRAHDGLLLDAREARRFAGHREVLDLKAGHIPGAVNVPVRDLCHDDNTLRSRDEIRERFERAGVTSGENVIVYSGSGNHSALLLLAMEQVGLSGAAHYIGGWSQWSADRTNPVERGE
ncbi:sulfurtransferase [Corynebacterium halotolerans]|uniref:sulfurtransferase n=1 Tax=Corynebacterium halotolerans TaxID=225326 RepID=UPI00047A0446|nr:sulfurtransferase [Corynebacterium halotolerans]